MIEFGLAYFTIGFLMVAYLAIYCGENLVEFLCDLAYETGLQFFLRTPRRKILLVALAGLCYYLFWFPITMFVGMVGTYWMISTTESVTGARTHPPAPTFGYTVEDCTRDQPHDGPCNGWPCEHVRALNKG